MSKFLSSLLRVCLCTLGFSLANTSIALAQVSSDNTVNTQVTQNGNVAEITGGETRGANLFHSFQNFSVPTDNIADFQNADSISNIFSRVTGGNVSNIDGMIRANGSTNLFLINPAGIMFGENASLNIGGSFYGSSASSILFENGEFSADLDNPPLLTVNAPIGLGFRDNPGEIINRSFVQNSSEEFVGLEVAPGNNLALIGGDIKFEAGEATAKGGNIELGGLSAAGTVSIREDGSLNFPQDIVKADVILSNAADVDVRGTGGGNINVNARNLELVSGELGFSVLGAGISSDSTLSEAQAGDITINTAENISVDDSVIINSVGSGAVGNSGNINISANNLTLTNGGLISVSVFGQGEAGSVSITSNDSIIVDGEDSNAFPSSINSQINPGAIGNVEGIKITTGSLSLTDGGTIDASTFGAGDTGSVEIDADTIGISGENSSGLFFSGFSSRVSTGAIGNTGGIKITTDSLSLTSGGAIDAGTFGQGNAGAIDILASDTITIDGGDLGDLRGIVSGVFPNAVGNSGEITLTTGSLSLTNSGIIDTSTGGQGDAGSITITASDSVEIDGDRFNGLPSSIGSRVLPNGVGNAGGIIINTGSLSLLNGAQVDAGTAGEGDAGLVEIIAEDSITIDGENNLIFSNVSSQVVLGATGNSGGVTIETGSLSLTNGGRVTAGTSSQGDAGLIAITARDSVEIDGESSDGLTSSVNISVGSEATGISGGVTIDTGSLSLTNGGMIDATTFGQGDAGVIEITAQESITIDGEGSDGFPSGITSIVNPDAIGNSGGVTIDTGSLSLTNEGRVAANAVGQGNAGEINIKANSIQLDGNNARIRASTSSGLGGIVNLEVAESITLKNNSFISAQAFADANGGNLTIDTKFIVAFPEGNNDIIASAEQGEGGNIDITAESLLGIKASTLNPFTNDINASSEFGLDGSVSLDVPDVNSVKGETELSMNILEPGSTTAQVCNASRAITAKNSLVIKGKGGVPNAPDLPLNSRNIMIGGEIDGNLADSQLPQPIATSKGQIQPARGIKLTDKGGIVLTAYRTNNQGDRLPQIETSCG